MPHERKDNVLDEEKLQEDVIKTYLVGKPLIHDPAEHLHVSFKFGVVRAEPIAMGVLTTDLEHLSNYITDVFKVSRCEAYSVGHFCHHETSFRFVNCALGSIMSGHMMCTFL